MLYGYMGKMLFVNLTDGSTEVRELTEDLARNFLGGHGLGAKILYDEMPANTDVFAPESMVGFVTGPMTGSTAFFGGRYTVVSKSPVTGHWNDASSGGYFGPMLKQAGFDAVFVKGIAEKPVYIFIDNGKVEIRDASHLWGKRVIETEEALRAEIGDSNINASLIGPAGERMSHMAAVMNDEHRAAGRGGTGAVMGSKKLKALVVRGNQKLPIYDKAELTKVNRSIAEDMLRGSKIASRANFGTHGTANNFRGSLLTGDAGVKNWGSSSVRDFSEEQGNKIMPINYEKTYKKVTRYACSSCPLGCGATYEIDDPKGKLPKHGASRPEYESVGGFGSCLLMDDADAVVYCNYLANDYGYDTISLAGTIGWAMECYDMGILSKEDLNGVDLTWGNVDAISKMTEIICENEGNAGTLLQNASQYAADSIGAGHEYLCTAGGIEFAIHDPRNSPGYGVSGITDPTPGRHTKCATAGAFRAKPAEVKYNPRGFGCPDAIAKSLDMIHDSAGFCRFAGQGMVPVMKFPLIAAVTGFNYTPIERHLLGMRIFHIRNAFNVRDGWKRGDFKVSPRMTGNPPLEDGPLAGVTYNPDEYVDRFYEAAWLDMNGKPYKEALEWMGNLDEVIKDLYG